MYAAYFQDRVLIAPGRLHEISFEDLEKDPLAQLQATYAALDLPSFEEVRPRVEQYVASLKSYRKNTFPQLPEEMRRRLAREWRQCFEAWGTRPDLKISWIPPLRQLARIARSSVWCGGLPSPRRRSPCGRTFTFAADPKLTRQIDPRLDAEERARQDQRACRASRGRRDWRRSRALPRGSSGRCGG
jgi:hypothetical protein